MLLAGVFLTVFDVAVDNIAAEKAEQAMEKLSVRIKERVHGKEKPGDSPLKEKLGEGVVSYVTIEEYTYIGYISIPYIGIDLPVLADCSYRNLNIAPSLYSGSYYGNDMVIAAHDYTSHFGRLNTLYKGADVIFTDVNGNSTTYEVEKKEELEPVDIDKMKASEYALSLFTCNFDGTARFTVRCNVKK